jgi:hypothetical protein
VSGLAIVSKVAGRWRLADCEWAFEARDISD